MFIGRPTSGEEASPGTEIQGRRRRRRPRRRLPRTRGAPARGAALRQPGQPLPPDPRRAPRRRRRRRRRQRRRRRRGRAEGEERGRPARRRLRKGAGHDAVLTETGLGRRRRPSHPVRLSFFRSKHTKKNAFYLVLPGFVSVFFSSGIVNHSPTGYRLG